MDIQEAFEAAKDKYLKFDRIENPLHHRPDVCAFIRLDQLVPGKFGIIAAAEQMTQS